MSRPRLAVSLPANGPGESTMLSPCFSAGYGRPDNERSSLSGYAALEPLSQSYLRLVHPVPPHGKLRFGGPQDAVLNRFPPPRAIRRPLRSMYELAPGLL